MSAAMALSWEMLARFRWWFAVGVAYLALACLLVALLPGHLRDPGLGIGLAGPLVVLVLLIHMSPGGDGDIRTTASCYPRRLFTLPASSLVLATVPLALPLAVTAALWFAAWFGLMRPCDAKVPLLTPILAVTAGLAWVQVLGWSPFPVRWLRFVLTVVLIMGLFLVAPLAAVEGALPTGVVDSSLALALALAFPAAVAGVRQGRRGVGAADAPRAATAARSAGPVDLTPFPSPFRAQLWLELRALGWLSLLQLAFHLLVILPMVHLAEFGLRTKPFLLEALGRKVLGPAVIQLGPAWAAVQLTLMLPFAFSFVGADASPHLLSKSGGMPTFFATRAVSEPTVVLAKMLSKAVILAALWGQVVVITLAWAAVGGHLGDMASRMGEFAGAPAAGAALVVGMVVSLVLANWLFMVGGVWVGLTGRQWIFALVMPLFTAAGAGIAIAAMRWQPAWWPWLVALVIAGLASKVVTTAWVCRRLVARRHATARQLAAIIAGWAAVTAPMAALAGWLLSGGWLTSLIVALLLPLAQTLAAPLALAWNRHR